MIGVHALRDASHKTGQAGFWLWAGKGVCGPCGLVFPNPRGDAPHLPRSRVGNPCH